MLEIKLNNIYTSIPAPTKYVAKFNPQQRSADRTAGGKLVRETLPSKWALEFEWEFDTPEAYYAWFNILASLAEVYFWVKFPAPTGNIEEKEFYIAPISATMINFSRGKSGWWKNLKCNFVEV